MKGGEYMGVKIEFDEKAFENAVKELASEAVSQQEFDVDCPHCEKLFSAHSGTNTYPHCHNIVELSLDIHF
jgi:Zn finger protein HypA/HybF involved in hydrogenase expression